MGNWSNKIIFCLITVAVLATRIPNALSLYFSLLLHFAICSFIISLIWNYILIFSSNIIIIKINFFSNPNCLHILWFEVSKNVREIETIHTLMQNSNSKDLVSWIQAGPYPERWISLCQILYFIISCYFLVLFLKIIVHILTSSEFWSEYFCNC